MATRIQWTHSLTYLFTYLVWVCVCHTFNKTLLTFLVTSNRYKKVTFSHTCYRALGPELIPVYRQPPRRWLFKSSQVVGCHYFQSGMPSPCQPKNVTVLRPVPSYTASWQRHRGVNNLPKVVTQLCPGENETHYLLIASPTLYWATVPPHQNVLNKNNHNIILTDSQITSQVGDTS